MKIDWQKIMEIEKHLLVVAETFGMPGPSDYEIAAQYISELEPMDRLTLVQELNGGREKALKMSVLHQVQTATTKIANQVADFWVS